MSDSIDVRDLFAAAALIGLLAEPAAPNGNPAARDGMRWADLADFAYQIAQHMLDAGERDIYRRQRL